MFETNWQLRIFGGWEQGKYLLQHRSLFCASLRVRSATPDSSSVLTPEIIKTPSRKIRILHSCDGLLHQIQGFFTTFVSGRPECLLESALAPPFFLAQTVASSWVKKVGKTNHNDHPPYNAIQRFSREISRRNTNPSSLPSFESSWCVLGIAHMYHNISSPWRFRDFFSKVCRCFFKECD